MLTACASNPDYAEAQCRADRATEAMAVQQFLQCETEALPFDRSARESASAVLYQTSAETIDSCLADLGGHSDAVAMEQRMQLQALSVANHVKAGDLGQAYRQLQGFEMAYDRRDLYFADGSSFIDSFRLLLGDAPAGAAQQSSLLNARPEIKSEMRRNQYWDVH